MPPFSDKKSKLGHYRENNSGTERCCRYPLFAGQQAGLGVRDLIHRLEAGMSIGQLTGYLVARLADKPLEN